MTDKTTAITIINQLGGNRFIMMTGARNFACTDTAMTFSIPRINKIKYIRITLNGLDLYDIDFINTKIETIKRISDVYADQLQDIFTQETGLYTSL